MLAAAAASPSQPAQNAVPDGGDPSQLDARTYRAVEMARRASISRPLSSRDGRRCDYSLADVALPPAVGSRVVSAQQERGLRLHSADPGPDAVEADGEADKERAMAWRRGLELHVVDMLRQVRLEPETLRRLLQVVGVLMIQQQENRDRRESKFEIKPSLEEASNLHTAAASISLKGPMARRILQGLHRVACAMGEDVYERVRSVMQRSVTRGALSLEANAVRLESVFKLELRRQVTVDSVLERMAATNGSTLSVTQAEGATTTNGSGAGASSTNGSQEPTRIRARSAPPASTTRRERVTSAHAFKMKALERILDAEWDREAKRASSDTNRRDSVATASALEAEEAALVHDKVTGFLYHRSRENFPFWREPPENALSREETARVLRAAISALLGLPMFSAGLSIEQLLEVLRSMKWRYLQRGQRACEEGQEIHEMLVLVEGSVAISTSSSEPQVPDSKDPGSDGNWDIAGKCAQADPVDMNGDPPPDTVPVAAPACVGELGMVRPGERWPYTLTATSPVNLLSLSRQTFEAQLLRMFASGKSKDALALSSPPPPQVTHPQPPAERPVSSPGMFVGGRRKTQVVSSLMSPANVIKVEEQVARSHRHREEALRMGATGGAATSDVCSADTSAPESETLLSLDDNQRDTTTAPTEHSRRSVATAKKKNPFQYYPSFSQSDDPSAAGDVTRLFRLKWAQPIAFEMQSDLEAVRDEWAPPFPDTSAFVDFLAPSSMSAIRILFDKPNLLSMASLHAVCRHHPFLDGAYVLGADKKRRTNPSAPSSPVKAGSDDADDVNAGDGALSSIAPMVSVPSDQKKVEELSLAQFSETRKKMPQGRSNSMTLRSMPSARSLALSPTVSGRNALLEPFAGSTFVLESSFQAGGAAARQPERGIPEQESGSEDSDSNSDDSGRDDASIALGVRRGSSPHRRGTATLTPRTTNDPASATKDTSNDDTAATMARKKTLDGLLQTGPLSKRMSKLVAAETAKQAIIQRHLQVTSDQKSPTTAAQSERNSSSQTKTEHATQPKPDEQQINSHAPLPLRVDLQKRMDTVLSSLRMRARAKLALVLKYTHADHYDRFPPAVVLWEQALRYVSQREDVLAALRVFEMVASDPRRHFRSLSTHRLREQKERDALFGRLNTATNVCREALEELRARCGDDLYLDDRLYRDKMQKDYTEMLFEVEQERLRAIYRGVKPGNSLTEADSATSAANGGGGEDEDDDERRRDGEDSDVAHELRVPELSGDNEANSSMRKGATSVQVRIPSVHRELPATSKSPHRSTVWRSMTASSDSYNSNQDALPSGVVAVEGSDAAASRARYSLQTPQESIYISIGDQLLSEQERARKEQRRTAAESSRGPEDTDKPTKAPLLPAKPTGVRGAMSHRMAAQVQAQRQAELEALTRKLGSSRPETPHPPQTPKFQQVAGGKDSGELRSSEGINNTQDDKSALRQLLRAFVYKN